MRNPFQASSEKLPPSERIYFSHTEEGLPIRVSKAKKIPIWGI